MQKDADALRAKRAARDDTAANGTEVSANDDGDDKTGSDTSNAGGVKVTFALEIPVLDKSKRPTGPATYITLEEGPVVKTVGEDTTSEPSNYWSGDDEGSPRGPARKISNISNTSSMGSEGDSSDLTPERKVDLNGLIEGVGTLIIPAVSYFAFCLMNVECFVNQRPFEAYFTLPPPPPAPILTQNKYNQSFPHTR